MIYVPPGAGTVLIWYIYCRESHNYVNVLRVSWRQKTFGHEYILHEQPFLLSKTQWHWRAVAIWAQIWLAGGPETSGKSLTWFDNCILVLLWQHSLPSVLYPGYPILRAGKLVNNTVVQYRRLAPGYLHYSTCLGSIRSPFCVEWECLSHSNDFPCVDKSQHGDLQLTEQPFGYTEPCSHWVIAISPE